MDLLLHRPSFQTLASPTSPLLRDPSKSRGSKQRVFPLTVSAKARRRDSPSSGDREKHKKQPKRELSRILRTEAAVRGVERKADAAPTLQSSRLWPKSVLESLDEAISAGRWESALRIFRLLRKQHWYQPRCQTYTKLLILLGKHKQPAHASSLFRTMLSDGLVPTIDVYTSLVGAYGLSGMFDEAFRTVHEMRSVSDCKPDVYTYTVLVNSCCKLGRFDLIDTVLTEMSYYGIECSVVTYNAIIDGYGKVGMFEKMEGALSDMVESGSCLPDVYTLNSIVWAYGNNGRIDEMERWYEEFQHMGVEPDIKTFNILIRSYGKVGMYVKMGLVLEFMKRRFFSPTIVTFNVIIETFGKAGNIGKMEHFFELMKSRGMKPNSVTYCSLVSGYSKAALLNKAGELKLMEDMFLVMKEKQCKPDSITFASMVQAYNSQGMIGIAQELESEMLKKEDKIQVTWLGIYGT
ncbi:Pentatricopeptide repeat-containing protein [Acorus gramineus]|uniref:Pentatricopeptide repeat-containing protein n=1 Tax=Acorus gramineus TaxID=55184 RepID=A0AAV9A2M4_ACOGR|nr:Pentatricopeptide repeat-containing protein [Acorus gramineus]KAK1258410.1 Pentatricopeptide repeat-containing protein [Acorus gramineus]